MQKPLNKKWGPHIMQPLGTEGPFNKPSNQHQLEMAFIKNTVKIIHAHSIMSVAYITEIF